MNRTVLILQQQTFLLKEPVRYLQILRSEKFCSIAAWHTTEKKRILKKYGSFLVIYNR